MPSEWNVYRTRFLVKARQLTEPLFFVDALGREHFGDVGDYLVESSDGLRRIAPRGIFEDIYVQLNSDFAGKNVRPRRSPPGPSTTILLGVEQHERPVQIPHPSR